MAHMPHCPGLTRTGLISVLLLGSLLAGCGPNYSPNTYSATAVQQANKVDQAVVVGVRPIDISATTGTGALAGGAAGGIAGTASGDTLGIGSALGALSGSVIGGIVGNTAEHQASDTTGFEYIVRKSNGDLMSVTQKDEKPLVIGTHVLIIAGNQARIVPDYTVAIDPPPASPTAATTEAKPQAESKKAAPQAETKSAETKSAETKPVETKPADTESKSVDVETKPAPQADAAPSPEAQVTPVPQSSSEIVAAPASAQVTVSETPLAKPERASQPPSVPDPAPNAPTATDAE
jgi:outer membrane lipoprotein SlyB